MNSSAKPLPPLELPLDDMKRLGYAVIDHLVEYWASLPTLPTTRHASRAALEAVLREPPPRGPSDPDSVFRLAMETVFGNVIDCCHPRNFSWVPSPGNFISVLADALTVGHNVSPGIWLEASGPSQVEVITIDWLRELCGLPDTGGGIFTSGGSMANLTALMAARTDRVGVHSDDAIIYHTNQAHASLTRGYRILGFRADQCRAVETDDEFRMSPSSLRAAIRQDRAEGKQPFCVVASAGTTNTGTVDPLAEIAAVCRDEGLWLHVDGAYGAATILTERGRALLEGLEMADSLSIDPHKWLFQPIEMGCCLVRDARTLVAGFSERPEYLTQKIELRRGLFQALANRSGKHVVPFTERMSSGAVYRDKDGPGAAPFPPEWLKAPNDVSRMNGLFPDTPEKLEAERAGRPYRPSTPEPPKTR